MNLPVLFFEEINYTCIFVEYYAAMKTLVIGASPNPDRYGNIVVKKLLNYGNEVVLMGSKKGNVEGIEIFINRPVQENVHSVTLYLSMKRQKDWYDYIVELAPKRVIFNPGAENAELSAILKEENIEPVNACTLTMLSLALY